MVININHSTSSINTDDGPLTIDIDSAVRVPAGNSSQRPDITTRAPGQLRFNTDGAIQSFEGWDGADWIRFGGDSNIYVSDTVPIAPVENNLWFNSSTGSLYLYYNDGSSTQWVGISGPSGGNGSPFVDTGTYVYYGGPNNVGIGTATPSTELEVVGDILASGSITESSDEMLKTNIETISDAINKVTQLRGVTYRRKSDMTKHIGLIAQEVQSVLPEVVHENSETGYLSVAYTNIIGVLVESIKEQQDQINAQNDRISLLEEKVNQLMESK